MGIKKMLIDMDLNLILKEQDKWLQIKMRQDFKLVQLYWQVWYGRC